MGAPIQGLLGKITSWGTSGDDCYHIINTGVSPYKFVLNQTSPALDSTAFGSSGVKSRTFAAGMGSWEVVASARFPKAGAKLGNQGLITIDGGSPEAWVQGWNLNISWDAFDITQMASTGPRWRSFMPGLLSVTGSYDFRLDSAAAARQPALVGTGASPTAVLSAVFKLSEEGATDNSFTVPLHLVGISTDAPVDGMVTGKADFQSSGDVTVTGSSNIIPSGTIDIPDWDSDADGAADRTMVFQTYTGRTYTGYAFLKSIAISCPIDGLIDVTFTAQGTGPLTPA